MELVETIKGEPKLPEWLSTHPSHENRAEHLDRLIPEVSRAEGSVPFPLRKVARINLVLIDMLFFFSIIVISLFIHAEIFHHKNLNFLDKCIK